jgi:Ribonuclease G/E
MSIRRLYLDASPGERRGVVTLDGAPERLLIERDGDLVRQVLGARLVGRVRAVNRIQNLAFVDLGEGPPAVLNFEPSRGRPTEGEALEVEVRAEARGEKGAALRLIGPAAGDPRLIEAAPTLEDRLRAFAGAAEIVTGGVARATADRAQEDALATLHPIAGGGLVAIEATRALVAVDVDLGQGAGADAKRAARAANLAALGVAARVLRLKGLGGLVAIDLIGRGHDAPALMAQARAAFAPDNPGVAIAPVSRFGVLELTVPRRARPALEILADGTGGVTALTAALALVRAVEREAAADRGGRFEALAAPDVAAAAEPALALLLERIGKRAVLTADPARPRASFEVARR